MSRSVRDRLIEMGAEQGGRKMTIRTGDGRGKPEVCANRVEGDWEPTAKYAKLLGQKTSEERKDDAKAATAAKSEVPAQAEGSGTGIPKAPVKKRPVVAQSNKKAPTVKKKAVAKKK